MVLLYIFLGVSSLIFNKVHQLETIEDIQATTQDNRSRTYQIQLETNSAGDTSNNKREQQHEIPTTTREIIRRYQLQLDTTVAGDANNS